MTERGMIFNGEMVRALLDGRKTQTRRIMKVQPSEDFTPMNMALETDYKARWYTPGVVDKDGYLQPASKKVFGVSNENEGYSCPFGAVGDRIWVREAFRVHSLATDVATLVYKASERNSWTEQTHRVPVAVCNKPATPEKWTPSLHMPRWASRILLEITDVRVERLNSISEEDAGREGYPAVPAPYGGHMDKWLWFRQLWDGIYPEQSFKHNPWVWVISFKRVEGGTA
ncbi:ASCH domain-containing protein [Klebsiella variicola]|uniref:hypothetical protein n=1 Tax=Klebsiella variicola TaxID=244366 RepID=UPI000E2AAC7B|nr:hypothetical protein [Klebsiella variicola]SXE20087.1 morphogenetic protein [Klebsiella variicola]